MTMITNSSSVPGDVVGVGQRATDQDRPMESPVIVAGDVGRVDAVRKGGLQVPDEGGGGPAPLKGGDVGEGFDGGAGLAGGHRHVHLPVYLRGSSRVDLQACKLGTGRRFTTS
jgi:hypothetical protein